MGIKLSLSFTKRDEKPTTRVAGQPASNEERSKWPLSKVIHHIKMSVRNDFGGKKADDEDGKRQVVLNRFCNHLTERDNDFAEFSESDGSGVIEIFEKLSDEQRIILADALIALLDQLCAGIAKRSKNHTDELSRRFPE